MIGHDAATHHVAAASEQPDGDLAAPRQDAAQKKKDDSGLGDLADVATNAVDIVDLAGAACRAGAQVLQPAYRTGGKEVAQRFLTGGGTASDAFATGGDCLTDVASADVSPVLDAAEAAEGAAGVLDAIGDLLSGPS